MKTTTVILRAGLRDLLRNPWIAAYAASFFVIAEGLFWFGGTGAQVMLSLLNVELMMIPLVALVFGTVHIHSSREFVEILLAQPVPRRQLFAGIYLGLAIPLAASFIVGVSLPLVIHGGAGIPASTVAALLLTGAALTAAFAGIAAWIALLTDDRLKAMGLALGAWLIATLLYDGVVLAITATFSDWPLERPMVVMMMTNPVDLARVIVLSRIDAPALLGYTGAVFTQAFGTRSGLAIASLTLFAWCAAPIALAAHSFNRRDF
jgi:Cu-processing system permease protein